MTFLHQLAKFLKEKKECDCDMPTTKEFKVSYKCESKFVKKFLELNKYG